MGNGHANTLCGKYKYIHKYQKVNADNVFMNNNISKVFKK